MNTPPGVIPLTQPVTQQLRRFGKYLLVQKIAEGGMAEIFLAKQVGAEGFERDVVVKCMLEHFTNARDFVEMFLDEARLAARLHHPNIVQISDLGVQDGRYFLCMEYLGGEDLQTVIETSAKKGEPVPLGIAARIILQALEGLEYAHGYAEGGVSSNLVHRDVSPSNIFVTFQGNVKVLDFGIAKASSKFVHTQPGTVKGKLGYMSPEQARGEGLDARSDLFSLGITLHELLTGRRVFQKDNEVGVLLAMMSQPIPAPSTVRPEIPAALDAIVLKATERELSRRYANAAEMRQDLESFLAGHISHGGSSQLATYLQRLFGPETVKRRTQIPTLKELAARGYVMPATEAVTADEDGFGKTFVRGAAPPAGPAQPRDVVTDVGPRQPTPVTPARRSPLLYVLSAITFLALAGVGALATGVELPFLAKKTPPPPPPLEEVTPPPVREEVAVAEPVEVESEPEPVEAPVETPKTVVASTKPERAPVNLTTGMIEKVIARKRDALMQCAERHAKDVPSQGLVEMVITIQPSGLVSDASASDPAVAKSPLGRCLSQRMERLKFPRNTSNGVLFRLPMRFGQSG